MNFGGVGLSRHSFKLVIAKTFCVVLCIDFLQVPRISDKLMPNHRRKGFKNRQIVGRKVGKHSIKQLRWLSFHDENYLYHLR